jgi:hypothetical protein
MVSAGSFFKEVSDFDSESNFLSRMESADKGFFFVKVSFNKFCFSATEKWFFFEGIIGGVSVTKYV